MSVTCNGFYFLNPNFSIEKFAPKGLLEQIRLGFVLLNKVNLTFCFASFPAEKILGLPRKAGRNLIDFFHATPRLSLGADFANAKSGLKINAGK